MLFDTRTHLRSLNLNAEIEVKVVAEIDKIPWHDQTSELAKLCFVLKRLGVLSGLKPRGNSFEVLSPLALVVNDSSCALDPRYARRTLRCVYLGNRMLQVKDYDSILIGLKTNCDQFVAVHDIKASLNAAELQGFAFVTTVRQFINTTYCQFASPGCGMDEKRYHTVGTHGIVCAIDSFGQKEVHFARIRDL